MHTIYHSDLKHRPFLLGRHGQSVLNAGEKAQGKAQGRGDTPLNGLTKKGREQAQGMYRALASANISVSRVSSSRLLRAQETATVFIEAHPDWQPKMQNHVPNLEEVSQAGWEMVLTRDEVMKRRHEKLSTENEELLVAGFDPTLQEYTAWIAILGEKGESPLAAALRGIKALEDYRIKPGELVVSHSMLNRYMDAVATRIGSTDRTILRDMYDTALELPDKVLLLETLRRLGLPPYNVDDSRNRVANGGVTAYTIEHETGLWIAGRRIEPSKLPEIAPFIEYMREADGMWSRITPEK